MSTPEVNVNVALVLAYEGTAYLGWQKTKEGPSIEETLHVVVELILQEKVTLQAASRTDAGVHAIGQVVNFFSSKPLANLSRFCIGLNSLLPKDIVVITAKEVPASFHPTLDCKSKEYHYWADTGSYQLPFHRHTAWHVHHQVNIEQLRHAAHYLIGRHDFSAFCNVKKNESYDDYVREITQLDICPHPDGRLQFIIRGNHFLYKMVRTVVGTLIYVGMGKIHPDEIPNILRSQDRTLAGVTAPAHGLTLFSVEY